MLRLISFDKINNHIINKFTFLICKIVLYETQRSENLAYDWSVTVSIVTTDPYRFSYGIKNGRIR